MSKYHYYLAQLKACLKIITQCQVAPMLSCYRVPPLGSLVSKPAALSQTSALLSADWGGAAVSGASAAAQNSSREAAEQSPSPCAATDPRP